MTTTITPPAKPAAIKLPLHLPTWPHIVQMAVGLAGMVLPHVGMIPASVVHSYPWLPLTISLVAGAVLLFARKPGAPSPEQLGALVESLVTQRASTTPTTPAAEARAQDAARGGN